MDGDDFCTQHIVKNHHLGHPKYLVYQFCPSPSANPNRFGLTFCCSKFQNFSSIKTWQCLKMLLLQRYLEAILKVIEQRKWRETIADGGTQQHPKMRCVYTRKDNVAAAVCVGGKLMFKAGNYKVIYINTERKLHRKELGRTFSLQIRLI